MNRKTSMSDSIGTTAYTYDALGNLIVEDGPFANDTFYYDYTPDRQLAAITSAFYHVEYAYDSLGRLSTVIGAEGTNTYSYAAAGTLWTNLTLANGTTAERSFDSLLRLTNLVNRADAGVLSSFALTLDYADQRTQVIREDGKIYTYSYDAIGQLTNASATLPDGTPWSGYQFSYTYDATGNPIEQNKNGLVYSNSFNNLNQNVDTVPSGTLTVLGEVTYPSGTATVNNVQAQIALDGTFVAPGIPIAIGTNTLASIFTDSFGRTTNTETTVTVSSKIYGYDLNGNLTNDSRFVYSWDCENRLTAVHDPQTGALIQSNRYDALWRRREKVEYAPDGTATTNRYIYRDWLVLAITDVAGTFFETYSHGADLSGRVGGVSGGIAGILSAMQDDRGIFLHYDFDGNLIQTTLLIQNDIMRLSYSPYGEILNKTGKNTFRYQYSTKETSGELGLVYFGYRFYSTKIDRWMNRDPIQESGGRNLYSFVTGDTINKNDAFGLQCDFEEVVSEKWNITDIGWPDKNATFSRLIDDATVKWHLEAEVDCCCDGEIETRTISEDIEISAKNELTNFGYVVGDPTSLPMDLSLPSNLAGAVGEFLASKGSDAISKKFSPFYDPLNGQELMQAINETQPKITEETDWQDKACE